MGFKNLQKPPATVPFVKDQRQFQVMGQVQLPGKPFFLFTSSSEISYDKCMLDNLGFNPELPVALNWDKINVLDLIWQIFFGYIDSLRNKIFGGL